jgi:predicted dehydrogenase
MEKLRCAIIGTGFWSNYQIPAWMELNGVEIVALCDKTMTKAEKLARQLNVPAVYDNVDTLVRNETLDFVDIITDPATHALFTMAAADKGIAVICQKPMAPKLETARLMVDFCRQRNVPLFVHENWRWQAPIRKVKELINENRIGKLFKARVTFCSAFPVFDNQPSLAELDEFILADIGSHILDVCRFLFGEVDSLLCHMATVNPKIFGEDVANVFMKMRNGVSCFAEMSYASLLEHESFPQTIMLIEGEHGSIHLTINYAIHITTKKGTNIIIAEPAIYPWVDEKYALVHSSIVDCNRNILNALKGIGEAETTGTDNLETVKLVHAAYASARRNEIIQLSSF